MIENIENRNEQDFSISLKVRDYECDLQGIVNNAAYMHYLEHARHEYLALMGLNFKKLIEEGIYLVAIKAELEYKKSLLPGQQFTVTCKICPESKFKIKFIQEIYNEQQEKILSGILIAAIIDEKRKPILVDELANRVHPSFREYLT